MELSTQNPQAQSGVKGEPSRGLRVSVIVPVYNGGTTFRRCLFSIKATVPSPVEIIVVGDGDTDGSSQLAEEFGVKVLRFPSPGGPGRARNLGASRATGEVLFFIDADVTVPPHVIDQVATTFQRDPDLAALIGSYDDEPGEASFLSQYRNMLHHYVHQTGCEEASTFWGACGAIRRDVFLAAGGFVETYRRPSIEDIELGYRLRAGGYKIRLLKSLQVKHWKRWEVRSMVRADLWQRAVPWTELILSGRPFLNDLNTSTSARMSVVLTFGLLGSLVVSPWHPVLLAAAGAMALVLLVLNAKLYRFFLRKRGLRFALQVIPWHWGYFFYSGLGFAIGLGRHLLRRGPHGRSQTSMTPGPPSHSASQAELHNK